MYNEVVYKEVVYKEVVYKEVAALLQHRRTSVTITRHVNAANLCECERCFRWYRRGGAKADLNKSAGRSGSGSGSGRGSGSGSGSGSGRGRGGGGRGRGGRGRVLGTPKHLASGNVAINRLEVDGCGGCGVAVAFDMEFYPV